MIKEFTPEQQAEAEAFRDGAQTAARKFQGMLEREKLGRYQAEDKIKALEQIIKEKEESYDQLKKKFEQAEKWGKRYAAALDEINKASWRAGMKE